MATTNSITLQTDRDSLFAAAVQIVREGGYAITKTDGIAKKIVYHVDRKGAFGGRFEATVVVSEADPPAAGTAMLRMQVAGLHNPATGSAANYRKFEVDLINFVLEKATKRFQVVTSSTQIAYTAGKSGKKGWLVLLVVLGLLAAVGVFGGVKLLAFLKTLLASFL